jgi:DNA-binding NtrC family response regulator
MQALIRNGEPSMFEPALTNNLHPAALALASWQAASPPRAARRSGARLSHLCDLYGACDSMQTLFATIQRVASVDAAVVVLGESGSGKELVANAIHQMSGRRHGPFIAVNCGAVPETLIESELFGHERGSFTGAARTHRGCFERASGGTLFLDEITEMPFDMQVRLLRALEARRFSRVGGDQEITADVRVIAATNRELRAAVAAGKLREDLMYRICVIPIVVPPLRERDDDVLLLAEMFLARLNDENGTSKAFTDEARTRIAAHSWPGNVRELRNVVHRAYVLSDDCVTVDVESHDSLPQEATGAMPAEQTFGCDVVIRVGTSLDLAERALIMATLRAVDGSKSKAAHVLGISLKTLYNRLHTYGGGRRSSLNPLADADARLAA